MQYTGIRVPAMHGCPKCTVVSTLIRSMGCPPHECHLRTLTSPSIRHRIGKGKSELARRSKARPPWGSPFTSSSTRLTSPACPVEAPLLEYLEKAEESLKAAQRTALLDKYVTELILLAKEQCPEAVVEVLFTRHEDEDAHIFVFLPEDTIEKDIDRLGEALTNRSVGILLDTGLLILTGVYEASQGRPRIGKPTTGL